MNLSPYTLGMYLSPHTLDIYLIPYTLDVIYRKFMHSANNYTQQLCTLLSFITAYTQIPVLQLLIVLSLVQICKYASIFPILGIPIYNLSLVTLIKLHRNDLLNNYRLSFFTIPPTPRILSNSLDLVLHDYLVCSQ